MSASLAQLHHLAGLYGIKTGYQDVEGNLRPASREALLAVLKAMGAPVTALPDVPAAIREKRQKFWRQPVEPVIVVWGGDILTFNFHLPAALMETSIKASLAKEAGETINLVWRAEESSVIDSATIEGTQFFTIRLYLPESLPAGYHRLRLEWPGQSAEALIISAPIKAYSPPGEEKIWGAFLPLYALQTRRSWGAGDFSDLATLMGWVAGRGGNIVGTLPLLPAFFDTKTGPGPYMPASRLFWNEFYLDIDRIPELEKCPAARDLTSSTDFQKAISKLRASHSVDYRRLLALKRQVLEDLSECFFGDETTPRFSVFQSYLASHRRLEDYASFRAAVEQEDLAWDKWPRRMRNGKLKEGDYAEKARRYYLYTQWLTGEQIEDVSQKARQDNVYLYLDLPVGVHPCSYDVWRERESFVPEVSAGAPPDPVFTSGQNWSFPPLHPEKIRDQGYRYLIDSLRHQLQTAGMLRIDHMMNFHRLFWIPRGLENREGVYAGYRAEEMYAILTLESCRHKSIIIGEDLGMVPPEVRPMMEKHGIYRMFISQYELIAEKRMGKIPAHSVASLNTHDMFPFAAFWQEKDIAERQKLKMMDEKGAQKELAERRQIKAALISTLQYRRLDNEVSQDTEATLRAILNLMAASPAYALLVNLEDLWLETHPQNVPATLRNQNWSRKARYVFEEFSQSPLILDLLSQINRTRKGGSVLS